jgi:hypothetical protein
MFLVVVMCFGLFATSAFADFDFGSGNNGGSAAGDSFATGDGYSFEVNSSFSSTASDSFAANEPAVQNSEFTLDQGNESGQLKEFVVEEAAAAETADNKQRYLNDIVTDHKQTVKEKE